VKGFEYAQEQHFSQTKEKDNFVIQIKNQDELIAFGSFYKDEGRLRINTINVASHHRGKGFVKDIYNELAKYAIKNNLAIETSMYSPKGESTLPFIKRKIIKENPSLLWLDTCSNEHQTKAENIMCHNNETLFHLINKDESLQKISPSIFRKVYDNEKKSVEALLSKGELDWDFEYQLKNNMAATIIDKSKIEYNKLNNKNNKKNKPNTNK